jgi:AhpC/TSA family protein
MGAASASSDMESQGPGWLRVGRWPAWLALAALLLAPFVIAGADGREAPELPTRDPSAWVGEPVRLADLRGQVVLLDVWTFGCINCVRTVPWVRDVTSRYAGRGLRAIGIHTPEFDHERDRAVVADHVRRLGLGFPQLLDNDYAYWNALGNQYWPAVYLVDRCGRIRERAIGEIHAGQPSGRQLEARIEELLAEPRDCRITPS